MNIHHREIGICGLSCRLCPRYHTIGESRCGGCKSEHRMGAGCPFITCAIKKKNVEFCWDCGENSTCDKWNKHREAGKSFDSFKCYQKLEEDIAFIQERGVQEFEADQNEREALLKVMLNEFDEGRSKSYYCIAATVLEVDEIRKAIDMARREAGNADLKIKAKALHSVMDNIAKDKGYLLRLRKS